VFLASHILAEVEALCDRVSIVRKGRIVESGTLAELRHLTRTTVTAEVAGDPSVMQHVPGVHSVRVHDHRVELEVEPEHLTDVLKSLAPLGVHSLVSHPPTLEELFMRHYQDGASD
jgi:ABC-2 type transport system ATP-binding protein